MKINTLSKAIAVTATAVSLGLPAITSAAQLEEIVVTAQKRAQNLNDVGVAVSAFSGEQIKELGIGGAMDMAKHTPGLQLTDAGGAGIPIYSIRGVGFDDVSSNSNSTVGLYVDEVAYAYPVMTRVPQFDVERVEVLKGPQGDLYGRNNTGGAINFINNKPTEEFEGSVTFDYGRYDYKHATGFINGSLTDSLNARLAFDTTQQSEGDQRNEADGSKLGEQDKVAVRALFDWAASDNVDVLLNVHAARDKSDNRVNQSFLAKPSVDAGQYYGPGYAWLFSGFLTGTNLYSPPTLVNGSQVTVNPGEINFPFDPSVGEYELATGSVDHRAFRSDIKPETDLETSGVAVTVNWQLDSMTLTSISAYDDFERDDTNDWDADNTVRANNLNRTEIKTFSQELRLTSDGDGDVNWIAGIYYSDDEVIEDYEIGFGDATNGSGLSGATLDYQQDTETRAVFAHAEWDINEKFRLTGGIRYTWEEREFAGCARSRDGGGVAPTIADLYNNFDAFFGAGLNFKLIDGSDFGPTDCVQLTVDNTGPIGTNLATNFNPNFDGVTDIDFWTDNSVETVSDVTEKVTAKVGLDFMPNEDWLIYASIGTGFKSGGVNAAPSNNKQTLAPYLEEELLAFELGFKATLLDSSMQVNGAVFVYDYRDKQVTDGIPDPIFGFLSAVRNVPESVVKGAELEVQWRPLDGLDIKLAGSYLDTEVKKFEDGYNFFTAAYENYKGNELPNAPELSFNALVSYEWGVADGYLMRATVDYAYRDDSFFFMSNQAVDLIEDYDVINARIGFEPEDGQWGASLWVKNLGDETYYTSGATVNDVYSRTYAKGETYGASFTYNF